MTSPLPVGMKKHHKITPSERDQIAWWFVNGVSLREIAKRLNRSPSTISAEMKRNSTDGKYWPYEANKIAEARTHNQHRKYLLKNNSKFLDHIKEKLHRGWSPQQIAGSKRRSEKAYARKQTTSITNLSTSFCMTQRKKRKSCRNFFPDAIRRDSAG
jgi:IS30 family transposase